MGAKTPPFPAYPQWTTAKFWGFVRAGLRQKWSRWPPRYNALKNARRTVTGKRHRYEYKCAKCKKWHKQKNVEVDHIEPVGSLNKPEDLPGFVERLFVGEDKLRILCKPCHKQITKEARERK